MKFYKVSFQYSETVFCSNIAEAANAADVEKHYSKYTWVNIEEATNSEVEAAKRKGMPIVKVEHIEEDENTETEKKGEKNMKYNNIAIQIKAEAANSLKKRIEAIKAGTPERVMKDNLTAYRWKQYQDGRITFEQAAEIATKRATEKTNKDIERKLARLEAVEQAADLESIEIYVEWKKNRTWGANPTATVYAETSAGYITTTGTASGCGYDKESAAIAEALNKIPGIIKLLCIAKEKALEAGKQAGNEYNSSNTDLIAYGAGYGAIPYFKGGVGTGSHIRVFEACGIKCELERHHKNTDFYMFKKVKQEAPAPESVTA